MRQGPTTTKGRRGCVLPGPLQLRGPARMAALGTPRITRITKAGRASYPLNRPIGSRITSVFPAGSPKCRKAYENRHLLRIAKIASLRVDISLSGPQKRVFLRTLQGGNYGARITPIAKFARLVI